MALSAEMYVADGLTDSFAVTFEYLKPEHVYAEVNGQSVTFSFTSEGVIKLDTIPEAGSFVYVYRRSPREQRSVVFKNPSIQDAEDFNRDSNQLFFLIQEALTQADGNFSRLGGADNKMYTELDMNGYRIKNLPQPIDNTDAVRLMDVEGAIADLPIFNQVEFEIAELQAQQDINTLAIGDHENRIVTLEQSTGGDTGGLEIGTVVYANQAPGEGYAAAEGTAFSQTTYPALASSLGDAYRTVDSVSLIPTGTVGLPTFTSFTVQAVGITENGTLLAAMNGKYLYKSVDGGATWESTENTVTNTQAKIVTHNGYTVLAGEVGLVDNPTGTSVLFTNDNGLTWQSRSIGSGIITSINPYVSESGQKGFIIGRHDNTLVTTYDFMQFNILNKTGITHSNVRDVHQNDNVLLISTAGTSGEEIKKYIKNGANIRGTFGNTNGDSIITRFDYSGYTGKFHGLETQYIVDSPEEREVIIEGDGSTSHKVPVIASGSLAVNSEANLSRWITGKAWAVVRNKRLHIFKDGISDSYPTQAPGYIVDVMDVCIYGDKILVSGESSDKSSALIDVYQVNFNSDQYILPTIAPLGPLKAFVKMS